MRPCPTQLYRNSVCTVFSFIPCWVRSGDLYTVRPAASTDYTKYKEGWVSLHMQDVTDHSDLIQRVCLNNPQPKPPLRWNVVNPEFHARLSGITGIKTLLHTVPNLAGSIVYEWCCSKAADESQLKYLWRMSFFLLRWSPDCAHMQSRAAMMPLTFPVLILRIKIKSDQG